MMRKDNEKHTALSIKPCEGGMVDKFARQEKVNRYGSQAVKNRGVGGCDMPSRHDGSLACTRRVEFGGQSAPQLQMPKIFRDISMNFGYQDTSSIMKESDGVVTPETETEIMMSGGKVQVNPRENLVRHLAVHLNIRNSDEWLEGISTGKIKPEVVTEYDDHIETTAQALRGVVADPGAYAEMIKQADNPAPKGEQSERPSTFQEI